MPRALRSALICCSVACALAMGDTARAGYVETVFDLTESTVTITQTVELEVGPAQVTLVIPESQGTPTGAIPSGTLRLLHPVVGNDVTQLATPGTCPGGTTAGCGVAITGLDLDVTVNADLYFFRLTGTTNSRNIGMPLGTILNDVAHSPLGGIVLQTETHLDCVPSANTPEGCTVLPGTWPIDGTSTQASSRPFTVTLNDFSILGSAAFTANLTINIETASATATLPAQVHLVGREVSRQLRADIVPEPGTLWLLGAGVGGLALASRWRRRQR